MSQDIPDVKTAGATEADAITEACRRLLAERYDIPGERWVVDRNFQAGVTNVDGVEHWHGSCVLSGVGFIFDMYCTPDRRTGDVLLFDYRTRLAVADKAGLATVLNRGGASLGRILNRLEV